MNAPLRINVSSLFAGYRAEINWSVVEGATEYSLERKLNVDSGFSVIYSGSNTEFVDQMPGNATSITYRIMSVISRDITWDEFDALNQDFDTLDALDWMWNLDQSEYTYSDELYITPNRPPIISDQDTNLGGRYTGFTIYFSAIDPDPNNTISLIAKLDTTTIFQNNNAQQGVEYSVAITNEQIFSWPDGSTHTVTITAMDNKGASSIRVFTFTAVEDLISTAVYYILRDDLPIARVTNTPQWFDYLAVGKHRYRIRTVDRYDNFSDSNEVEIEIIVEGCTLALVNHSEEYLQLRLKEGEKPQRESSLSVDYGEVQYENRTFPVFNKTTQRHRSQSIAMSTTTQQEADQLDSLIAIGDVLIYRDLYDKKIVGVIKTLPVQYFNKNRSSKHFNHVDNFSYTIEQCDYDEVVQYD